MKEKTNEALQNFVREVARLAHSVSSVAGTDVVETLYSAEVELIDALQNEDVSDVSQA